MIKYRRCILHAEDLPAQEAPEIKGSRLPTEDVHQKRPEGACKAQSKGPRRADPVILRVIERILMKVFKHMNGWRYEDHPVSEKKL